MARFITPPALPEDEQCRGLVMPSSKEWLAIFSQALLETTYAYHYEQLNAADLTPEETAAVAWGVYEAWLEAECSAGGCTQPGGARVYRTSPTTGRFEYLEDEAWVEDTAIPPTAPSTELEAYYARCKAASNAADAMHDIWAAAIEISDAGTNATDALLDYAAAMVAIAGSYFAPPIIAIMSLLQAAWEIIYYTYQLVTYELWDEHFTEVLTCLLMEHASWDDVTGVVTFDNGAFRVALTTAGFTGQAYLLQVAQTQFMLDVIGPQGLDALGALDRVEGDCGDCGEWCREWLTGYLDDLFTLVEGAIDGNGDAAWAYLSPPFDGAYRRVYFRLNDLDTTDCEITSVQVRVWAPAGGVDYYTYLSALPGFGSDSSVNNYFNYSANAWHRTPDLEINKTTSNLTDIGVRVTSNNGSAWRVTGIRLTGRGRDPFTSGSVC